MYKKDKEEVKAQEEVSDEAPDEDKVPVSKKIAILRDLAISSCIINHFKNTCYINNKHINRAVKMNE